MPKYIEREAVLNAIRMSQETHAAVHEKLSAKDVIFVVKHAPAADVEPVKHGRWVTFCKGTFASIYVCSECRRRISVAGDRTKTDSIAKETYQYCHCGTKMDLNDDTAYDRRGEGIYRE